jgi:predicted nucleic acid-binding protein
VSIFLDTSVLVAAFWGDHPQHDVSVALLKTASPGSAFCAAHTVAEVYSKITRPPVKPPIPPEQALLFVQQLRQLFTIVTLTDEDYFSTVERLAHNGLAKSYIYDALIVRAAEKSGADIVYTWNVSDFLKVSPPSILSRIRVP